MLNEDYRDMLQALADENVKFQLVGAYAMSAHGYPRATMDIDIWIMQSPGSGDELSLRQRLSSYLWPGSHIRALGLDTQFLYFRPLDYGTDWAGTAARAERFWVPKRAKPASPLSARTRM